MRYTPMRWTPMRYTPIMRCTPVNHYSASTGRLKGQLCRKAPLHALIRGTLFFDFCDFPSSGRRRLARCWASAWASRGICCIWRPICMGALAGAQKARSSHAVYAVKAVNGPQKGYKGGPPLPRGALTFPRHCTSPTPPVLDLAIPRPPCPASL